MSKEKEFPKDFRGCANCYFFDKFAIQKREDNLIGACHANPPQPAQETYDKEASKLGSWPLVLGSWWCGMFDDKFREVK